MTEFRVRWEIDIDGVSAADAARNAESILADGTSYPRVPGVYDVVSGRSGVARKIDTASGTESDPDWCVLLRLPDQDELDPCDRIRWNVKAKSAKTAATKARKELAKRRVFDPDEIGVSAIALGEDSILLPW